jgi:uncharacterized protein (TIGR02996 family)
MREQVALLQTIIEHPDDDVPRLIYADWLEEHGDGNRAEFIRTQIELARGATGKRKSTLEARQADLLSAHAEQWVEPLRQWLTDEWSSTPWTFRRGFVEEVDVLGETLVEFGHELFAAAPIRGVHLPDEEDFEELAKCRHLLRLRSIDLTRSVLCGNVGLARLFRSRYLANLETLIAQGYDDNGHLYVEGIRGIVKSNYLRNLQHLDVSNNWFGVEGTVELLKACNLTGLQRLEFEGVGMDDEGAVALARTGWLSGLKFLNLVANYIGERGALALLASPFLQNIEQLDLRNNEIHREDIDPISDETRRGLRERFGKRVLL